MRHTRFQSPSCCCCSFSNLQPPPSRGGRSIYTRRATACACDVLNLSREEVVASAGRPTHTSFFGTPPSVLPFPLQPSPLSSSLSLFRLRSPSTSLATVRRASHAGRYRCPFDLPRSSRVRKSASVARPSHCPFSRSTTSLRTFTIQTLLSARPRSSFENAFLFPLALHTHVSSRIGEERSKGSNGKRSNNLNV